MYYGNQNDETFSQGAKIGDMRGKFTNKARSSGGGKTNSMKSGHGSGGYGNNNSNDANTSNKSYDEKIA